MKRKLFTLILSVSFAVLSAQNYVSLAEWTFDGWLANKVMPDGVTSLTPLAPDKGTTDNMSYARLKGETYASGRDPEYIQMPWSASSKGGYTRTTGGEGTWNIVGETAQAYYIMSGINAMGYFGLKVSASFCTSGNGDSYAYTLKPQYRVGAEGAWKDFGSEFTVTLSSETVWTQGIQDVSLPTETGNAAQVDIRFLCTSPAPTTSTQYRINNFIVKAFPNATSATIYNTFGDVDFGNVEIGQSKSVTVDVIGRTLSGALSLSAQAPFASSKTSISPVFGTVTTTNILTFTPTAEGAISRDFTISGGGAASRTVSLSGVGVDMNASVQTPTVLDYIYVQDNMVWFSVSDKATVIVSDITGVIQKQMQVESGIHSIDLRQGQVYLINVGGVTKKVVL